MSCQYDFIVLLLYFIPVLSFVLSHHHIWDYPFQSCDALADALASPLIVNPWQLVQNLLYVPRVRLQQLVGSCADGPFLKGIVLLHLTCLLRDIQPRSAI